MPVPTASLADHVDHVILSRIAVESPESGQPELQAGRYNAVPLMSWPWARKVLVAVCVAVTLGEEGGETGGDVGPVTGPLGDPAGEVDPAGELAGELAPPATLELLGELQAVSSKAAQASDAQAATRRAHDKVVVSMDSPTLKQTMIGSASHNTLRTFGVPFWFEAISPGRLRYRTCRRFA